MSNLVSSEQVALAELESLQSGAQVYLRKGQIFLLSSVSEVFANRVSLFLSQTGLISWYPSLVLCTLRLKELSNRNRRRNHHQSATKMLRESNDAPRYIIESCCCYSQSSEEICPETFPSI